MIGQTQKPLKEILGYLQGKEKVVLVGCGGCATVFHTGGKSKSGHLCSYWRNLIHHNLASRSTRSG